VIFISTEKNKALVRRSVEAWVKGNWALLDEFIVTDYVDHDPLPGQAPGREGYKQAGTMILKAFPDFQIAVEDMIAEGDKVVVRSTCSGTHKGEFMGIAPTGKKVTFTQISIYRIVGGKFVEEWSNMDTLGFLQQLGVIPPFR